MHPPKNFQAIMLSSTFTDLEKHRQTAIKAIEKFPFKAVCMEHDGARADLDVLQSSLQMVRDSVAYLGVISRKYGQTPDCEENPKTLSITELEFDEAVLQRRPVLLFIMGEKHPVTEADIELDPKKRKKLDAFRKRAKRMRKGSAIDRVWEEFSSLEDFSNKVAIAIGRLVQHLPLPESKKVAEPATGGETKLPQPPALCALPRYLGSHAFVGRASELEKLSDWCAEAEPNPMLLYEAIGGSGKSMLTWEWLTGHADRARSGWAGRFWFSFYEKGAVMSAFCRYALAYMTERPVAAFAKLRTPDLADQLIAQLEQRPWLLVLDGLERVLVAYHRHDAAQLADEEADTAADQIGKRNPCAAIRPEDDELLRRLAAAAPSKILISSRLTPQALVSRNGLPVPGVRRETLGGLRPADAETMLGVRGNSNAIRDYLQKNCNCHPLTIGALAGLINAYPRDHGNFDRWVNDPHHGGALDLGRLDLIQRRNHILKAAVDALTPAGRQLLQTLALLQGGSDYETLEAFNPHLPSEPEEVGDPEDPKKGWHWKYSNEDERATLKAEYQKSLVRRQSYLAALAAWKDDLAVRAAPSKLAETIRDLEQRGLLQYEANERRYDLHPVVRGVVAGQMASEETQRRGQEVFDHFNSLPHNPWEQAETLEDLAPGLQVVRVLLRMRRHEEAMEAYRGGLSIALIFNLQANTEMQSLLKPFFPDGWEGEPVPLGASNRSYLLNDAAISLRATQAEQARKLLERRLVLDIGESSAIDVATGLQNLGSLSIEANRLADAERLCALALDFTQAAENDEGIFGATLHLLNSAVVVGNRQAADRLWTEMAGMGRAWSRAAYRPGDAEEARAWDLFHRDELTEEMLQHAEALAKGARNRNVIESLYSLRGEWQMLRGEPGRAIDSLAEAVRMAREVGAPNVHCEALLAMACLRAGEQFDAHAEAERLSEREGGILAIAELWYSLGERARAVEHALRAHKWYVAEGEPYVQRYRLDRTRALLTDLGEPLPKVPRYDPGKAKTYPFEADVRAFIDKLNAQRARKKKRDA